jgi:hypothetical protein
VVSAEQGQKERGLFLLQFRSVHSSRQAGQDGTGQGRIKRGGVECELEQTEKEKKRRQSMKERIDVREKKTHYHQDQLALGQSLMRWNGLEKRWTVEGP